MTASRHLSDIRSDLTDGEDLALAVRLITDALSRRMLRARRLLDEVEDQEAVDEGTRGQLDDLRRRADEVEGELGRLSERFSGLLRGFEAELAGLADELDEPEP